MTRTTTSSQGSARWVPLALVALGIVPAISGSLRLTGLVGGPGLMPVDTRIDASPLPVIVHIASVIPYSLLGAFQFSARLRRRHPRWHRSAGRALVPLALAVALSGVWMTLAYAPKPGSGALLVAFRLAVGTSMAGAVLLGFAAIRRRDVTHHRAWMTRAYALALGAGTQVFTGAVAPALVGTSTLANDLAMGAAWALNLTVAEYVIRRPGRGEGRRVAVAAVGAPAR